MEAQYHRGLAFVVEGETEKVFYHEYLANLCLENGYGLSKDETAQEDIYEVTLTDDKVAVVMFWSSNSVSQMVNGSIWFARACAGEYPDTSWTVFLCYDTDDYNSPISRFHEGDWVALREDIGRSAKLIVDLAAEADIEDILLCDLANVLNYLKLPVDTPVPYGNKGKTKLKKLHWIVAPNITYHEGSRARPLIQSLDMGTIKQLAPIPLDEIDKALK